MNSLEMKLVIAFRLRNGPGEWVIDNSKELVNFRKHIEAVPPEDFISARITHERTHTDKVIESRDSLIEETYFWLMYNPMND